jgi:hypothetical protein
MAEATLTPSLEPLLAAIAQLDASEKHQLWQYLDSELFEDDDELTEQDLVDIKEAYADYAAGDYLTYKEFMVQRQNSPS